MLKKITIELLVDGFSFDRIWSFHIKEIKNLTKEQITEEYKKIVHYQRKQNFHLILELMTDQLKKIEKSGEDIKVKKDVKECYQN